MGAENLNTVSSTTRYVFLRPTLLILCLLHLTACVSTHNLNTDGFNSFGGGFAEEQLRPGFYRMTALSNLSPWPNFAAAHASWKTRAGQLCGKDAYQTFDIDETSGERPSVSLWIPNVGPLSGATYNARVSGYVICTSSGMTITDAKNYLKQERAAEQEEAAEAQRSELVKLGGENCNHNGPALSAETYFRRGKALMALQKYSSASLCFLQSQKVDNDGYYHKESSYMLGMMYETGMGVEKNLEVAKFWFSKSGL